MKGWRTIKQWGDCLFMFTPRQQLRGYHREERRANEHHPPSHLVPRKVGLPTPPSTNDRKIVIEQLLILLLAAVTIIYYSCHSLFIYWNDKTFLQINIVSQTDRIQLIQSASHQPSLTQSFLASSKTLHFSVQISFLPTFVSYFLHDFQQLVLSYLGGATSRWIFFFESKATDAAR